MQKVEGSSPFIRSSESPGFPGLSWFLGLRFNLGLRKRTNSADQLAGWPPGSPSGPVCTTGLVRSPPRTLALGDVTEEDVDAFLQEDETLFVQHKGNLADESFNVAKAVASFANGL